MLHGVPGRVTKGAAPDAVQAARPVLNGEDEETSLRVLRLVLTQHYAVVPLPITAAIEVYLARRRAWRAEGWVAHVREHAEDVRLLIVARFPSSSVNAMPSGGHG